MARWAPALLLPLVGYFVLVARPEWDVHWQDNRAHFWLVVSVALANAALGLVMSEVARRRGDARVFLVSLTFLCSSGFFALHALATPGVLLTGKNTGFVIATPVGLTVAGVFAALSGLEFSAGRSVSLVRHERLLRTVLVLVLVAWGAAYLASVPPLDRPPPEEDSAPVIALAVVGVVLYAVAAWRYLRLYRRHPSFLLVAVTIAFVLLAEALVAVAFARSWHATWWEWHVLMTAAFLLVALSVRREYRRGSSIADAFGSLYLEHTISRVHDGYGRAVAELAARSEQGGRRGRARASGRPPLRTRRRSGRFARACRR